MAYRGIHVKYETQLSQFIFFDVMWKSECSFWNVLVLTGDFNILNGKNFKEGIPKFIIGG